MIVDTAADGEPQSAEVEAGETRQVEGRSVVVLSRGAR